MLESVEVVAGCHALLAGRLQLYKLEPLVDGGNEKTAVLCLERSNLYAVRRLAGLCCLVHLKHLSLSLSVARSEHAPCAGHWRQTAQS